MSNKYLPDEALSEYEKDFGVKAGWGELDDRYDDKAKKTPWSYDDTRMAVSRLIYALREERKEKTVKERCEYCGGKGLALVTAQKDRIDALQLEVERLRNALKETGYERNDGTFCWCPDDWFRSDHTYECNIARKAMEVKP